MLKVYSSLGLGLGSVSWCGCKGGRVSCQGILPGYICGGSILATRGILPRVVRLVGILQGGWCPVPWEGRRGARVCGAYEAAGHV